MSMLNNLLYHYKMNLWWFNKYFTSESEGLFCDISMILMGFLNWVSYQAKGKQGEGKIQFSCYFNIFAFVLWESSLAEAHSAKGQWIRVCSERCWKCLWCHCMREMRFFRDKMLWVMLHCYSLTDVCSFLCDIQYAFFSLLFTLIIM